MSFRLRLFWAVTVWIAAQTTYGFAQDSLAITNVTVIDGTDARPRPAMTILVANGKITAVERSNRLKLPAHVRRFDAAGKFAIPGLWDMHVHIWDKNMLFPAYIANGITGVRDMGTSLEAWVQWKNAINDGSLLGPRAVISGHILDGFQPFFYFFTRVTTPAEARDTVAKLAQGGADFIKVYERLSREVYFAIADAAKSQRLPFAGHVPVSVRVSEGSDAGQRSMEHLAGIALEASRDEASLRARASAALQAGLRPGVPKDSIAIYIRLAYKLTRTTSTDSYDPAKAAAIFKRFRANSTWQVPTLVVLQDDQNAARTARLNEQVQYFPEYVRGMVITSDSSKSVFERDVAIVGAMKKAGVRILAGSDAPNPNSAPGFGLHEELELLVRAGFTPLEALQSATRDAAEFLGIADTVGTIAKGKVADLVLLERNPLADIRNTRSIAAVVVRGKLVDKTQLQMMLDSLKVRANRRPAR